MKRLTKKANEMTLKELASYIDYSVLKPEFTEEQIVEHKGRSEIGMCHHLY